MLAKSTRRPEVTSRELTPLPEESHQLEGVHGAMPAAGSVAGCGCTSPPRRAAISARGASTERVVAAQQVAWPAAEIKPRIVATLRVTGAP